MDNRRLLFAVVLSLVVMLGWGYLAERYGPAPTQDTLGTASSGEATPEAAPPETESLLPETLEPLPPPRPPAGEATGESAAGSTELQTEAEAGAPAAATSIAAEAEERVVVESDEFRAELTNRGAQILSFRLKQHPGTSDGLVDLVRGRREGWPYPFALVGPGGRPLAVNEALFTFERLAGEAGREVVSFSYSGELGRVSKRFSFLPDGRFEVDLVVAGEASWSVLAGPGIRNPTALELENRFARRTAVYRLGDELETVDAQSAAEVVRLPAAGIRFVGLQDIYFLTAMAPSPADGWSEVVLRPVAMVPDPEGVAPSFQGAPDGGELPEALDDLTRDLQLEIVARGERLALTAYWGAKQYDRLRALPGGLEETVNLGFFKFLSRPLLFGLLWIHDNVVANYGWAIILMTVLIRLLLFPLTHKSTVSMQKMQQLNPKIQAIRQKYRPKLKDKQGRTNPEMQRKMNEEVMGLYKQEGVNPAGGCMPMVLQIPVLFAFYSILSAAIELRHAPWIMWIQDLSAPDPIYVLPVVMGASQLLQQKMTPSAGDPMQRRIFLLMPIFFTILFLGFPSGLVLYWLTNNVLGIAQQLVYKRLGLGGGAKPEAGKKKGAKGTGAKGAGTKKGS